MPIKAKPGALPISGTGKSARARAFSVNTAIHRRHMRSVKTRKERRALLVGIVLPLTFTSAALGAQQEGSPPAQLETRQASDKTLAGGQEQHRPPSHKLASHPRRRLKCRLRLPNLTLGSSLRICRQRGKRNHPWTSSTISSRTPRRRRQSAGRSPRLCTCRWRPLVVSSPAPIRRIAACRPQHHRRSSVESERDSGEWERGGARLAGAVGREGSKPRIRH